MKSDSPEIRENPVIILRHEEKCEPLYPLNVDKATHATLKKLASESGLPIYRVACELVKQAAPLVRIVD